MSTGTEASASELVGVLAETVERGASLLAGGSRLAGPAAAQDDPTELVIGEDTIGLGLTFADGVSVSVVLDHALADEICGGHTAEDVRSGLQVVVDEVTGGYAAPMLEAVVLTGSAELVHFLAGRPALLGAGIFDGDDVVATVGAAAPAPGAVTAEPTAPDAADSTPAAAPTVPAAPPTAASPTAASPTAASPTAAPAAAAPSPGPTPTPAPTATSAGPPVTVSDQTLARGLALLADVHLSVTAELGRSHLRVSELLALEPGAVIGLEREAGSPVDLLVNGSPFARAEVIVVDERYAVRITELIGGGVQR